MNGTIEKIEDLKISLTGVLEGAVNPVLLWSGGADSTLLLFLLLELRPGIGVIQFRADGRKAQLEFSNSIVRDKNLRVFYYAPRHRYFVPKPEGGMALVDEYSFGETALPVIREAVHDDRFCGLEISGERTPRFDYRFDKTIAGWRKSDAQILPLEFELPARLHLPETEIVAPLYDFSPEEIREISDFLELPKSEFYLTGDEKLDTGNFVACTRCLERSAKVFCPKRKAEIEGAKWAAEASLENFKKRFRRNV